MMRAHHSKREKGFTQHFGKCCFAAWFSPARQSAGFTLIEAIVYLALFAIVMGGAIVSSYSIIESMGRNQSKAIVQEEGDFLIGKINWAISGASSVDDPPAGSTGSSLSVTKWDPLITSPVAIALSGTDATIKRGAGAAQTLNNDNVQVTTLSFRHLYPGGTNPESVETALTLSARTPNGFIITEDFSSTNYLRR